MASATIESDLRNKSIGKLLIQYSGPAIIETLAVSVYNIIDSIFIGHDVGAMALSAMAIALPLMNLVIAFCTLIASGGSAVISIFLGRQMHDKAQSVINNVMLMCIIHSVVFAGLMLIFLNPILELFGATSATITYAYRYMRVILIFTPISYVFLGLNNMMRATGYPKKAMISALLSVLVNIGFCFLFILKLHWSMEGAALATVMGQLVALVWCVLHFCDKNALVGFNFKAGWWDNFIIKKLYSIGFAPFLMNICACVVVVFLNHSLLEYGKAAGNFDIGAYGILNKVTMVFVMTVQGITLGMQPIIGYNYGANCWDRVKKTLYTGIKAGVVVTCIGWILSEGFPDMISSMFTTSKEMIEIARKGFRIYFIVYPLVGAEIVIQNFFQYIDKPKYSIILSTTRQLVFLLPFLIFFPHIWGVNGVWASMAAADGLAFLLALIVLLYTMRKFDKMYDKYGTVDMNQLIIHDGVAMLKSKVPSSSSVPKTATASAPATSVSGTSTSTSSSLSTASESTSAPKSSSLSSPAGNQTTDPSK